jgi:PAS domain S-box-containing protein
MTPKEARTRHITISLIIIAIFTISLYLFTPYLINIIRNPQDYLWFIDHPTSDTQVLILSVLFYTLVVLIGYIVYLLATSSSRAELISEYKTKDLSVAKFQLEELYENSPVPYLTINKEGEIHGCNKSALRFFGVVPEEISGKNFFLFTTEEDKQLGEKYLNFFKSDSPINKEEIRLITKDGSVKWVSLSIFLTKDSTTKEKNGLVTVFDITEQKQLDQAKTEFVSLASHQLRTPLVTIKWYAEMLNSNQLGELNEKQKDYLNKMYSVNTEMIDLVEILLNVSRIEIGTLTIAKQATNVPGIID